MAADGKYRGVVVPMVSPFTPDGRADEPAVARVVTHLLRGGVGGIFALGTTGESASISMSERRRIVQSMVAAVGDSAVKYAGISGNCLSESVEAAQAYGEAGMDAVVAHVPFYFPLSANQVETYFVQLADRVPLPLVLYNIPQTTHHSISLETVGRLKDHPNIVAIKDSANDMDRLGGLLEACGGPGGFPVLLGCSALFARGLRMGAVGLVPSGAHLVPRPYQAMFEAAMEGRWNEVDSLQAETDAACSQYAAGRSVGESIAQLKALLEQENLCGRTVLPPLQSAGEAAQ